KVCAFAVVSLLNEIDLKQPTWINTCYSLISPDQGISIAMVYKLDKRGKVFKVKGAGGVTPNTRYKTLSLEAKYAQKWFKSITNDSFN
ncbi:MAG: FCSD flavin-binding domain-containing protein, partial [Methylococcales bacterium]|nr:FCSD flavin-binding domain-containing protein [Methylococcales bacterium]